MNTAPVVAPEWRQAAIWRVAEVTLGKMLQSFPSDEGDSLCPYLRAANVQPNGLLVTDDISRMWFSPAERRSLSLRAEDVVVVEGGAGYGRSAIVQESLDGTCFQNSILRLRPKEFVRSRFLHYWLEHLMASGYVSMIVNIATIQHFTAEKVKASPIWLPSRESQQQIADFLDRETSTIDAFIADQERLIELLIERLGAAMTSAITKGLEHGVPTKPDQLGWLSSRPAHWRRAVVKRLFASMVYGTSDASSEGPVTAIGMGDVTDGKVRLTNRGGYPVVPPGLNLVDGDLLFNRTNSLALVGKVGLVDGDTADYTFASYLVRCRTEQGIDPRWACYALNCPPFLSFARGQALPSIGQANLSSSRWGSLEIPLPPHVEQTAIADHLDVQCARTDALVTDARRAIELSRERRSALITAAVTGQIDVRTGHPRNVSGSSKTDHRADREVSHV